MGEERCQYGNVLLVLEDLRFADPGKRYFRARGSHIVDVVSTPLAGLIRLSGCHPYHNVAIATKVINPSSADEKVLMMTPQEAVKKLGLIYQL
ncbi:MAG: hypothetical protein AAB348_01540 [Patescibacteria group bacterium]